MYMQIPESMHAHNMSMHIIHGHANTQKHAHTHSLCMHIIKILCKQTYTTLSWLYLHTHTQPYVHNAHIHILQWHTHTKNTPSLVTTDRSLSLTFLFSCMTRIFSRIFSVRCFSARLIAGMCTSWFSFGLESSSAHQRQQPQHLSLP